MLNYIKSGECVVVVCLCVMKPLCGKASVWQVSCTDFDFTLCVARLDFCNLVRYAAAATLGLKTRAYDHVCFYRHLNDIPVQKVRDIQIYRGRKVCKKKKHSTKPWLPVLISPPPIAALMWLNGDTYRSGEYCSGFLHSNRGYKYKCLLNEVAVVSKATIAAGILGSYSCDRQKWKKMDGWVDEWGKSQ